MTVASLASFLFAGIACSPSTLVLTNCTQIRETALRKNACADFDIIATISEYSRRSNGTLRLSALDGNAAITFEDSGNGQFHIHPGDIVKIKGSIARNEYDEPLIYASTIEDIAPGPPPPLVNISGDDLMDGRFDNRLVRIRGVVREVFIDDIDPHCRFLILASNNRIVYVSQQIPTDGPENADELVGATVSVTGLCRLNLHSLARPTERRIERMISSTPDNVTVLQPAVVNPSELPKLSTIAKRYPEDIDLGQRYHARGRVLATWHGDTFLLRQSDGPVVRVKLITQKPPHIGDSVEVVGFPESNLFTLGLFSASWHPHAPLDIPEPDVADISVRDLMEDDSRKQKINVHYHGRSIRIVGLLHSIRGEGLDSRLILSADGYNIPIDPGENPEAFSPFPVGSRIAVTGTCLMEIDDWRRSAPFPRVRGFSVILRSPNDVNLIERPTWWTTTRLITLLFSVLAILLVSAIFNIILKRLVARRSRQIEAEVGARILSECKVRERTRLAVEIHDAISQNLTGVAFQLQTVRNSAGRMAPTAKKHLDVAERTLGSCRDELRNCLWDLRNNALECSDMNEAIRQTLAPHLGNADLSVRFDIARARFTDNFAHALLHIIRELATNAIRHGHAKHIWVAGCIDNGKLRFSVADDGCGFDPTNCPSLEDGHFGLMGIRERIDGFEGEFSIKSGNWGTKATASMSMNLENDFRKLP